MKKTLLMGLSIALVAVIAIFGTLAYFTDTDGAVNVMTVGNVQIELVEQQRTFDTSTASGSTVTVTTGLEDFEQNKELMPIVGSAQGEKDQYGLPIAKNYVDKIVRVENTGDNDAYVRVIIAVPAALEESTTAAGKNALHWNLGNRFDENGTGAYNSGDWKVAGNPYFADFENGVASNTATATIDGIEYNLYTYTCQNALASDELTAAVITGFYLDDGVDFDGTNYTLDGQVINYDLSKGVIIPVMAQAVQAAGFDTAEAAFAASSLPANPWSSNEVVKITEGTATINNIITVGEGATDAVTVTGADTVVTIAGGYYDAADKDCAVWAYNGGKVIINDGYFICDGLGEKATSGSHQDMIYAGSTAGSSTGTIEIKGGFFVARSEGAWLLNESDNRGEITVYGGTFVNWNPADNVSEGANTNFLADGYKVVSETQDNGDIWYTVVAE